MKKFENPRTRMLHPTQSIALQMKTHLINHRVLLTLRTCRRNLRLHALYRRRRRRRGERGRMMKNHFSVDSDELEVLRSFRYVKKERSEQLWIQVVVGSRVVRPPCARHHARFACSALRSGRRRTSRQTLKKGRGKKETHFSKGYTVGQHKVDPKFLDPLKKCLSHGLPNSTAISTPSQPYSI